ncbi:MAG: ribonuclease P protein component [Alphaproteobacteria bacterium]|nr:ribonuclease P protein component [Alphaproteobacteria bacterium]
MDAPGSAAGANDHWTEGVVPAQPGRLRHRADFLRVAAGRRKVAVPGLVLQAAPRPAGLPATEPPIRVGFTASRKVGGAVVRNRARRRLRAAVREVLARAGQDETDYVLIARAGTVERPYAALVEDLRTALAQVAWQRRGARP